MDAVVAICGSAKGYPLAVVFTEGAKSAIMADSAWNGGRYDASPEVGLRTLARYWAPWGRSPEWWRRETFRDLGFSTIEDYLESSESFWLAQDANNLLWQLKMWQRHDVGHTPGFGGDLERALRSIEAKVLFMPSETDMYFPVADSENESRLVPDSELVVIPSIWGHVAGGGWDPSDAEFLNREIARFLAEH